MAPMTNAKSSYLRTLNQVHSFISTMAVSIIPKKLVAVEDISHQRLMWQFIWLCEIKKNFYEETSKVNLTFCLMWKLLNGIILPLLTQVNAVLKF